MGKISKKLSGLLSSQPLEKIKNLGAGAIGEILSDISGTPTKQENNSNSSQAPQGKRFEEEAPQGDPYVEDPSDETVGANKSKNSLADKILELNSLREQGILNDEEFETLKKDLLKP
jgi:hypothetical protein